MNRELAKARSDNELKAYQRMDLPNLDFVLRPIGEFMKWLAGLFGFIFNIFT